MIGEYAAEREAKYFALHNVSGQAVLANHYAGDPHFFVHYHPEYELVLTRGGAGKRLVGDQIDEYDRLDLCLLGPNLPHTYVAEPSAADDHAKDNLVLHFTCESLGLELLNKPECAGVRRLLVRAAQGLAYSREMASHLGAKFERAVAGEGLLRLLATLEILATLADSPDGHTILPRECCEGLATGEDQKRFIRVLSFVHQAHDRAVTLQEVAEAVALTVPTFTRFFKRVTGTSFFRYLNQWRVRRAAILLKQTDRPIIEIAGAVGYANLSHFNRQFRRALGCTPREYRREHMDLLSEAR